MNVHRLYPKISNFSVHVSGRFLEKDSLFSLLYQDCASNLSEDHSKSKRKFRICDTPVSPKFIGPNGGFQTSENNSPPFRCFHRKANVSIYTYVYIYIYVYIFIYIHVLYYVHVLYTYIIYIYNIYIYIYVYLGKSTTSNKDRSFPSLLCASSFCSLSWTCKGSLASPDSTNQVKLSEDSCFVISCNNKYWC